MTDRTHIHRAIDDLLDAIDEYRRAPADEELIRVRDVPLEANARGRLVREGRLRAVRIGRELWTRRSWVAAVLEDLPPAQPARGAVVDDIAEAIARRRRRA